MRGKWGVVLALTTLLAACGTTASSRPSAQATGHAQATGQAQAQIGSRAAALALARQMLAGLVVPTGARVAHPSPVPLRVSSARGISPYTVDLDRFVLVREPAATVHAFLLRHVAAGMSWYGDGVAPGATNTVTALWVAYRPRSVAVDLVAAELGAATLSAAGGTLVRADASVSWFPRAAPRST